MIFRIIASLMTCLLLTSCNNLEQKNKYNFIYEFENNSKISQSDRLNCVEVLKRRLSRISSDFEVKLTNDKKIAIKVSTAFEKNRLNDVLTNQGKLEFWELYKVDNLYNFLGDIDKKIRDEVHEDSVSQKSIVNAISSMGYPYGPILFYVKSKDTVFVNSSLKKYGTNSLLPEEYSYTKFLWGIPNENGELPLYVAKSNRDDKAFITGEHIIEARQNYNAIGRPTVSIQMDDKGSMRWERMTERAYNEQTCIAVTLNDLVYSAPGVSSGPIRGGNSEISGDFTLNEAQDLAIILNNAKSIPKLKLLTSSTNK